VVSEKGYTIPLKSRIVAVSWSFNCAPDCGGEEVCVLVDGADVGLCLSLKDDTPCKGYIDDFCKSHDLWVNPGACINVVSRKDCECYNIACGLVVNVWIEVVECDRKEKDVCHEALLFACDEQGGHEYGDNFEVVPFTTHDGCDEVGYTNVATDGTISLKQGWYCVDYHIGYVETDRSSNYTLLVKLQVDKGSGWEDVVCSNSGQHDLAAANGGATVSKAIAYKVPEGDTHDIRVVAKTLDLDSSFAKSSPGLNTLLIKRKACCGDLELRRRKPRRPPEP
jgi:hypothetical protein